MIKKFRHMPEPLQKQILVRLGYGALAIVLLVALLSLTGDLFITLPCVALALFFITTALLLYRQTVAGEYVIITGECIEAGISALRRHTKYIVVKTDACELKVMLRSRRGKIKVGANVELYVSSKAQIHSHNDANVLYDYISLRIV